MWLTWRKLAGLLHVATSVAVDIVEQCPEELLPQLFPAMSALPQAAERVRRTPLTHAALRREQALACIMKGKPNRARVTP